MRERARTFPTEERKAEIRTIRIWHCKYKSLQPLAEFENLEEIVIATFPDKSLDMLALLNRLRYVSIQHMPNVSELDALSGLNNLESLSLSTSPAWDASGRCTVIGSLSPVARMKSLKHLELFGICTPDKSLAVLEELKTLQSARFSQYPKDEVERFYRVTGVVNRFNPKPSFQTEVGMG